MQKPSIGRIVRYYPGADEAIAHWPYVPPFAAMITCVHDEQYVNLTVFDSEGGTHPRKTVELKREGDVRVAGYPFCEWPVIDTPVPDGAVQADFR